MQPFCVRSSGTFGALDPSDLRLINASTCLNGVCNRPTRVRYPAEKRLSYVRLLSNLSKEIV